MNKELFSQDKWAMFHSKSTVWKDTFSINKKCGGFPVCDIENSGCFPVDHLTTINPGLFLLKKHCQQQIVSQLF